MDDGPPDSALGLMYSLRRLSRHQARRLRERYAQIPVTSAESTLIRAGYNIRRAKGRYRDAYTPDELEILHGARRVLVLRGQKRAANMLLVTKPRKDFRKLRWSLGQNPPERHPCPRCGRVHHAPRRRRR
jgi:hypothetical protein